MDKVNPCIFAEPQAQIDILAYSIGKDESENLRTVLAKRFSIYDAQIATGAFGASPPEIVAQSPALGNLYKSRSKSAKNIRNSIRKNYTKKCPYCGEVTDPYTLDHIVPKTDWPEYSLYAKNLIPVCSRCNLIKNDNFIDPATSRRAFLNPYIDEFASMPFFDLIIVPDPLYGFDVPSLEFKVADHLAAAEKILVLSHFDKLDIICRMRDFITKNLRVLRRDYLMKIHRNTLTSDQLIDDLSNKIYGYSAEYGHNSWYCVFYRSVIANLPLVDFIVSTPIIPPPS